MTALPDSFFTPFEAEFRFLDGQIIAE